jgi:hypothetical protein
VGADIPENPEILELIFLYPAKHFCRCLFSKDYLNFKPLGCSLISGNRKYLKDSTEIEGH